MVQMIAMVAVLVTILLVHTNATARLVSMEMEVTAQTRTNAS